MELGGGKEKRLGVFGEFLRDSQRFREVYRRIVDKLDKVECRFRLAT